MAEETWEEAKIRLRQLAKEADAKDAADIAALKEFHDSDEYAEMEAEAEKDCADEA